MPSPERGYRLRPPVIPPPAADRSAAPASRSPPAIAKSMRCRDRHRTRPPCAATRSDLARAVLPSTSPDRRHSTLSSDRHALPRNPTGAHQCIGGFSVSLPHARKRRRGPPSQPRLCHVPQLSYQRSDPRPSGRQPDHLPMCSASTRPQARLFTAASTVPSHAADHRISSTLPPGDHRLPPPRHGNRAVTVNPLSALQRSLRLPPPSD